MSAWVQILQYCLVVVRFCFHARQLLSWSRTRSFDPCLRQVILSGHESIARLPTIHHVIIIILLFPVYIRKLVYLFDITILSDDFAELENQYVLYSNHNICIVEADSITDE